MIIKEVIRKSKLGSWFLGRIDNLYQRTDFVARELAKLPKGQSVLDAGCGSQQFRKFADHLVYYSQDFGKYVSDDKAILGSREGGLGGADGYQYGSLDYVGDIWAIEESDAYFDNILCTEVFEHIPYPIEAVREFGRLVKPGGHLILTVPSNCLRHMDPYFFSTGFTDRWLETILNQYGFDILTCDPVGDYYSWMAVETFRAMRSHSLFAATLLLPSFLYFLSKKPSELSRSTLCEGYHVVARKRRI